YLLHAQTCSEYIEQYNLLYTEAGDLLFRMGQYHWQRGENEQVKSLHQRALAIREQVLGSEHVQTANSLNELALLYSNQGKYEEAEPLYQRALTIREKVLPPDHPDIASSLENYANLLRRMNRSTEATLLKERAKEIRAKRSN
ncbi:MAG TPA: tetratricopeptide repeat protein, partial [Ktedonobacteraceae bacterium]|nr:tetratricopeptide repeat protein [Ktedonobacteraceae bacterium]